MGSVMCFSTILKSPTTCRTQMHFTFFFFDMSKAENLSFNKNHSCPDLHGLDEALPLILGR